MYKMFSAITLGAFLLTSCNETSSSKSKKSNPETLKLNKELAECGGRLSRIAIMVDHGKGKLEGTCPSSGKAYIKEREYTLKLQKEKGERILTCPVHEQALYTTGRVESFDTKYE